jgi:hypothetical protein
MEKIMDRILTEVTVTETRDLRYGEIFLVKGGYIEIYNTTGLNNCPPQLWDALELEAIKTQFDAQAVQLNGPKFWMMDSQTLSFGETLSFGGLEAEKVKAMVDQTAYKEYQSDVLKTAVRKEFFNLADTLTPEEQDAVLELYYGLNYQF